jgi:hypothetical protein
MKSTHINTLARLSGLTTTIVLFAGAMAITTAGEIPTGKGAAKLLMKPEAPVSPAHRQAMPCPDCKDEYATRKDLTARGATKPTVTLARHLCQTCATTTKTVGQGKAKHDVVTHACTSNKAEHLACCATQ